MGKRFGSQTTRDEITMAREGRLCSEKTGTTYVPLVVFVNLFLSIFDLPFHRNVNNMAVL